MESNYMFYDQTKPRDTWLCRVVGTNLCYRNSTAPNWFWRKMQYIFFGFKWEKITQKNSQ
jgi:hypothetical protein